MRHTLEDDGSVTLDQDEYISAMKRIEHSSLAGMPPDARCSLAVDALFLSLLGALAYALLTQHHSACSSWLSSAWHRRLRPSTCVA